jgi:hypothetical protein
MFFADPKNDRHFKIVPSQNQILLDLYTTY